MDASLSHKQKQVSAGRRHALHISVDLVDVDFRAVRAEFLIIEAVVNLQIVPRLCAKTHAKQLPVDHRAQRHISSGVEKSSHGQGRDKPPEHEKLPTRGLLPGQKGLIDSHVERQRQEHHIGKAPLHPVSPDDIGIVHVVK